MCCSPWGHKESDMTEWLNNNNNKTIRHVFPSKKWMSSNFMAAVTICSDFGDWELEFNVWIWGDIAFSHQQIMHAVSSPGESSLLTICPHIPNIPNPNPNPHSYGTSQQPEFSKILQEPDPDHSFSPWRRFCTSILQGLRHQLHILGRGVAIVSKYRWTTPLSTQLTSMEDHTVLWNAVVQSLPGLLIYPLNTDTLLSCQDESKRKKEQ